MATRLYLHNEVKPVTSTLFSSGTGVASDGFNNTVRTIAIQPDGKILVGGDFTAYTVFSNPGRIIRLNVDGTVDTEFITGTGFSDSVTSIAVQTDGKILVGGAFTSYNGVTQNFITRLNADGTRDTGFTIGTGFNSTGVESIALQSDGKILVGGGFTTYNGVTQNRITRLNADGTRDAGFTIGTGFDTLVLSIAVQSTGKILMGGYFTNYNGVTQNYITRLNTDGTRDTGFNSGGAGANSPVRSIALQSDGKIVVGGFFNGYNGVTQNYITRLNADGTVDTSFSIGTGFNTTVNSIAIQLNGKILVGGDFISYNGETQNKITRLNADGTRDAGFNSGTGFNTAVQSIALQTDGKILVGGNFTSYNDVTQNKITRIDSDGTRNSQNVGFTIGTGFNSGTVQTIIKLPDGKILVSGSFTNYNGVTQGCITRLNSNGTRDNGFNSGGTGFNLIVESMALQTDGKIVAVGQFTSYNGVAQSRIIRLNADGSKDTGFSIGTGFDNILRSVAIQPDGKILLGGGFTSYNGVTQNGITRLNSDGTLDTGFNSGGAGISTLSSVQSITVQPDGKILLGGSFTSYNGVTQNRITRLNSDGTLDTGFNSGGAGFSGGTTSTIVYPIVVQTDGKILVGGNFTSYNGVTQNYITRLNADGTLDTGFNSGGAGFSVNGFVYSIAVLTNGKIIAGGEFTSYNGVTQNRIIRLNADGTRDAAFFNGTGITDINSQVRSIVIQTDGKILVGGSFTSYNGVTQNRITRLDTDGIIDPEPTTVINLPLTEQSAATADATAVDANTIRVMDSNIGVGPQSSTTVTTVANQNAQRNFMGLFCSPTLKGRQLVGNFGFNSGGAGFDNTVESIAIQPDGKILAVGNFTSYNGVSQNRITRLNADGTIDTGFNSGGTGFNFQVESIALQPDGKIIVGGIFSSYNGVTQTRITRLNADGTRDTGFTIGTGFNGNVFSIAVQPDGKILVGGSFTSYNGVTQNRITRLNADGTLDTGFNSGGAGFSSDSVYSIAVQPDGKILVGGSFTTYNGVTQNYITRLNADGTRDTGFTIGTGFNSFVFSTIQQSDGKILVGGNFTTYNGTTQNYITRLNADGTIDTGFNSGGTGFNNTVLSIALQPDGKILVGGAFTTYNGVSQSRITRLNADGTRDTGFTIGTGFDVNDVLSIALQSDGKILVGGLFSTYNGVTQNYSTRLNTDGTRDAPGTITLNAAESETNLAANWWINALNVYVWRPSTGQIVGVVRDFSGFNIGTGFDLTVGSTLVQPDGKILVGGSFTSYNGVTQNRITRLNADGTRDTGFAIGLTGFNGSVESIAIQPDGKILVGGFFTTYNGAAQNYITRLNADGTLDGNFNLGGAGFDNAVFPMALQPDGKIVVGGSFTTYNGVTQNRITRLNANGSRDTGFSVGTGFIGNVFSIAVQPDGKILVGGSFTSYNGVTQNRITRLNADGTRDTGFTTGTGVDSNVNSIVVQPDGKILVGGLFTTYNGVTQNRITRLNADGTIDTGFNSGGAGFDADVNSIAVQSDGKILVGGAFSTYNGETQSRITRLNADGTRDTGFLIGTGTIGVESIDIQPDGKIVVGGQFSTFNGVTQNRITRLNADGALDTPASATAGLGGTEPTAAASIQVSDITGIATTPVQAENGDVIICEVWASFTQGMSTAYSGSFYYDGTTVNTTENAVVTNHASFVEFSENLLFGTLSGRAFVVMV